MMQSTFERELEQLINRHSIENGNNTPGVILARYLIDCLSTFNTVVNARDKYIGIEYSDKIHIDSDVA